MSEVPAARQRCGNRMGYMREGQARVAHPGATWTACSCALNPSGHAVCGNWARESRDEAGESLKCAGLCARILSALRH